MPPTDSQRLAQTQRPAGLPVMKQRWAGLGLFHWEADPEIIAARLPTHGGSGKCYSFPA